MSVTAVIIARGGSQRLPNKNMLDFHGLPLVAHKVRQLKQCRHITGVAVGSDSLEILQAAEAEGAETVRRAPEYCDEKSRSWNEVIYHMLERTKGDIIVWAHCTNPCIRSRTYDRAIEAFRQSTNDSLIGVTPFRSHVWWHGLPLNFDPRAPKHVVAAELEPIYYQNGGLFIAKRVAMLNWQYVYGTNPLLFEIHEQEAIDIDTAADYEHALKAYDDSP